MVNDPSQTYLPMEFCFPTHNGEYPEVPPNPPMDCRLNCLHFGVQRFIRSSPKSKFECWRVPWEGSLSPTRKWRETFTS